MGGDRVERDRDNAVELVELCMRLPLALSVAAARLVARPAWSLGEMVDALAEEQQRLAALTIGDDMAVRSALDGPGDALRWLETERGNLRAAVQAARELDRHATAWQLADANVAALPPARPPHRTPRRRGRPQSRQGHPGGDLRPS